MPWLLLYHEIGFSYTAPGHTLLYRAPLTLTLTLILTSTLTPHKRPLTT